jgi:EpsI family protein
MAVVFLYTHILAIPEATQRRDKEFPVRISDWTSVDVIYDEQLLNSLSPDRIIYKSYHDGHFGAAITLFMAYYNSPENVDRSHSPIVCFTGQGWHIDKVTKKVIPIKSSDAPEIAVNHMIQNKLDTTMITLFWHQTAERAFTNRGIQKLFLFFAKLLGKQDGSAFVRLTMIVPSNKSVEETTTHLFSFVGALYPELKKFFL